MKGTIDDECDDDTKNAALRLCASAGLGLAWNVFGLARFAGSVTRTQAVPIEGGLRALRGASMACARVAGVAALLCDEDRREAIPGPPPPSNPPAIPRRRARLFAGHQIPDRGVGMICVCGTAGVPID